MKLIKIVKAYTAAEQMRWIQYYNGKEIVKDERELPFEQASVLVRIMTMFKPYYEGYISSEKSLANQYAKKDENGNIVINDGSIIFDTIENKRSFDNEIKTLQETEIEVDGLPLQMPKPNTVRCSWIENLDGVVEFV